MHPRKGFKPLWPSLQRFLNQHEIVALAAYLHAVRTLQTWLETRQSDLSFESLWAQPFAFFSFPVRSLDCEVGFV